jgi:predicted O-methyltransferase YrrM
MIERPKPIIPQKPFIDLIEKYKLDDFATINFKCLKYVSGNISLTELFTIVMTVALFKPKHIMEFGTFNGRTTLNMAINSPLNAIITTVDLPREKRHSTKYTLEDCGNMKELDESGYVGVGKKGKLWQGQNSKIVNRIKQVWEDTARLNFRLFKNKIDFLFIDASHSYENCKNDSNNAHKLIKAGGIVYWHDFNGWPGVTEALNEYYLEQGKPENMFWFNDTSIVGRFF